MKNYSVFKESEEVGCYGKKCDYVLSMPACKEDRRRGVGSYLIFFTILEAYGEVVYDDYYHGERKVGEKLNLGKSITRHLTPLERRICEKIIKDEFGLCGA